MTTPAQEAARAADADQPAVEHATADPPTATPPAKPPAPPAEYGGPAGPEPTRYGDWERKGRVSDF